MSDHRSLITSDPCAVSSVVEHYLDTVGVRGSKPLPRTRVSFSMHHRIASVVGVTIFFLAAAHLTSNAQRVVDTPGALIQRKVLSCISIRSAQRAPSWKRSCFVKRCSANWRSSGEIRRFEEL